MICNSTFRNLSYCHVPTCAPKVTAALFLTVEDPKQCMYQLRGSWLSDLWWIHAMEYYLIKN